MSATSRAPEKQVKPSIQRPLTALVREAIRQEFNRMKNIKEGTAKLYSQDYVIHEVAKKFYKSPKTIENIIYNRVK